MAKKIEESLAKINRSIRCSKIVFDCEYKKPQTILQEYEEITTLDDRLINKQQSAVYKYDITDLMFVEYMVNGKKVTGWDVMQFLLIFNDDRDAALAKAKIAADNYAASLAKANT